MKREDWLLLLLGVRGPSGIPPPPVDRVRTMKALFVFGENFPDVKARGFYSFEPYNYGPFDSTVYRDAEKLIEAGLAEQVSVGNYAGYRATQAGIEIAEALCRDCPREASFLAQVREWVNRLPFNELLKAIYQKWPHYRASSVFVG